MFWALSQTEQVSEHTNANFKENSQDDAGNYKPVGLTSVPGRCLCIIWKNSFFKEHTDKAM